MSDSSNQSQSGNWYQVFESFDSNGEIRMTIVDTRDNTAVTGIVSDIITHTKVWEMLSAHKALGSLPLIRDKYFL